MNKLQSKKIQNEKKETSGIIVDKGRQRSSPAPHKRFRFAPQVEELDAPKPQQASRVSRSRHRQVDSRSVQNGQTQISNSGGQTVTWSDMQQPPGGHQQHQQYPGHQYHAYHHHQPQQHQQQYHPAQDYHPHRDYQDYNDPYRQQPMYPQYYHFQQQHQQQMYLRRQPMLSHHYPLEQTFHQMNQMKSNYYPGDLMYYPAHHPQRAPHNQVMPDSFHADPVMYPHNYGAKNYDYYSYEYDNYNQQNPVMPIRSADPHSRRNPSIDQRQPDLYLRPLKESIYSRQLNHSINGKIIPKEIYFSAFGIGAPQQAEFFPTQDNGNIQNQTFDVNPIDPRTIGHNHEMFDQIYQFVDPVKHIQRHVIPQHLELNNQKPFMDIYGMKQKLQSWELISRDIMRLRAPLTLEHAEDILEKAILSQDGFVRIHEIPVFRPKGYIMYLLRKANRNFMNADGYNWTEVACQTSIPTTRGFAMDYRQFYITSLNGSKMSSRFRKETFTAGDITLVAVIGDERKALEFEVTIGRDLVQTYNSNSWPRPKNKIRKRCSRSLERRRFDWFDIERTILPQERRRRFSSPDRRILTTLRSEPILTPNEWYIDLMSVCKEISGGKLVKNISTYPNIQATLVHPETTRDFEYACQVLSNEHLGSDVDLGIRLFYDWTFPIGKYYATLLTYSNACYEGSPVMPLAINIHENKFISCHQLFWARIVGDIPALKKFRFPLFIDEGEPSIHLAVRTQAPNLVQLELWIHRFRDIDLHFRQKGYGREAIRYFKACVCYLLGAKSKQSMHDKFRMEFEYIWPRDFVQYYKEKILPRSGRLGQWALSKVNIHELHYQNPNLNPQESFYQTCRHFLGWESLTLSQMVHAFNILFLFFAEECNRGKGTKRDSAFRVKDAFKPFFIEFSRSEPHIVHPSKISEYVLKYFPTRKPLISSPRMPKITFQYVPSPRLSPIENFSHDEYDKTVKENNDDIEKMLEKVFAKHEEEKAKGEQTVKLVEDGAKPDEAHSVLKDFNIKTMEKVEEKVEEKPAEQQHHAVNVEEKLSKLTIEMPDYKPKMDPNKTRFEDEYDNYYKGEMKRTKVTSPGVLNTSSYDPYYDQEYYNEMYGNRLSERDRQQMYESRFPMDTDLLVDVSMARSSMLELTKGAIESRIIEEIPRELQEKYAMYNYDHQPSVENDASNSGQCRPQTLLLTGNVGAGANIQYGNSQPGVAQWQQQKDHPPPPAPAPGPPPPTIVVNSSPKKPASEKTGQTLTKLKETFISKPVKSKSFIKKLFKSKGSEKSSNQTSSDGSIDVAEAQIKKEPEPQPIPASIGASGSQFGNPPAPSNNTNNPPNQNQILQSRRLAGNSYVTDDPYISNRPSPTSSLASMATMVPSRGPNLMDFDSISFDSNNTCRTNTRSIILDEYDSDGSSSATTLPSFETNLLQLSNMPMGQPQLVRESTFERRAKFAQKDGMRNYSSLANGGFHHHQQQQQQQQHPKRFNVNDVDIDEIYRNWKSASNGYDFTSATTISNNSSQPMNNQKLESIYHLMDNIKKNEEEEKPSEGLENPELHNLLPDGKVNTSYWQETTKEELIGQDKAGQDLSTIRSTIINNVSDQAEWAPLDSMVNERKVSENERTGTELVSNRECPDFNREWNQETSLVPYRGNNEVYQFDNSGLFESSRSSTTFQNDNGIVPYSAMENDMSDTFNVDNSRLYELEDSSVYDNDNALSDPMNSWIQIHEEVQIGTSQRTASAMHAWTSEDASMSSVSITENVSVVAAGPNILGSIAALAKQHGDEGKGSSSDTSNHSARVKAVSVLASAARTRSNPLSMDEGSPGGSAAKDTGILMNKGGMMLWRKVQNCVVVGAGIVNSANQTKPPQ